MTGTLRLLAVVVVVLLAGYGAMLVVWPEARPSWRPARRLAGIAGGPASQQRPSQGSYEQISAEIVIPSADEVGPLEGCPKTQLGTILGVSIEQPHGLGVGDVVPDGPAAKAGVMPGDQLGRPSDCPNTTLGRFVPGDEARTVAVTITRREPEAAEGAGDGEPATAAEEGAAGPSLEEESGSPP